MSDTNTPVPNADEQAAAILLKAFDLAIQASNDRIYALKEVMHNLTDLLETYHTNEGKFIAIDENTLKSIIAGLHRLAREQSPPPATTNEQAASTATAQPPGPIHSMWDLICKSDHRAPTPIPIPPEGAPDSAKDSNGRCWFGFWFENPGYWAWSFFLCTTKTARNLGYTHYLPGNTPTLPANTPPAP